MNGRIVLTESVATDMSNIILRLSVIKLQQRETILVARTEHPSMPARTYEIFGLTIAAFKNVTREGLVCILNLF